MAELAVLLGLDKSSVSGLVDRAQRRGLVRRAASPQDGRVVHVELSDEGRALITAAAAGFAEDVTALLAHLEPSDRDTLSQLLNRLLVGHAANHGIDLFPEPE